MARQRDRTLYVVSWDEAGIVKIGFTDNLRQRQKAFTGARVVLALTFPTSPIGYHFESRANLAAFAIWPRAFANRADAEPYIGDSGRGYFECYRTTAHDALELIASQCDVTMPRHNAKSQCDASRDRHTATSRSYGRTDGLTEISGFRDGKIFTAVTRGREVRFSRFTGFGRAS